MTLKKLKRIANILEGDGYKAEIRDDYSGRGMFGATCYGIVTDGPEIVDKLTPLGTNQKIDNMGLDYIVYFPNLKGKVR